MALLQDSRRKITPPYIKRISNRKSTAVYASVGLKFRSRPRISPTRSGQPTRARGASILRRGVYEGRASLLLLARAMSLIKRELIPFMCGWCLRSPLDPSQPSFRALSRPNRRPFDRKIDASCNICHHRLMAARQGGETLASLASTTSKHTSDTLSPESTTPPPLYQRHSHAGGRTSRPLRPGAPRGRQSPEREEQPREEQPRGRSPGDARAVAQAAGAQRRGLRRVRGAAAGGAAARAGGLRGLLGGRLLR